MQGLDRITFRVRGHDIHVCPSAADSTAVDIWSSAVPLYLVRVYHGDFTAVYVSERGIHIPSALSLDSNPVIPGSNECVIKFSPFPGLMTQNVLRASGGDWAYVVSGSVTERLQKAYNDAQKVSVLALSYNHGLKAGSLNHAAEHAFSGTLSTLTCLITMQSFPEQPEATTSRIVIEHYMAKIGPKTVRWSIEWSMDATIQKVERKVYPFVPYDEWNTVPADLLTTVDNIWEIQYNRTYDFPIGLQRFHTLKDETQ